LRAQRLGGHRVTHSKFKRAILQQVCRDAVRLENSAACVLNTIFLYRQR
jgi:hypothetical protein